MWLAVDSGNSFIKWALLGGNSSLVVEYADSNNLQALSKAAAEADDAWVSHVGSVQQAARLRTLLAPCGGGNFLISQAHTAGVKNNYQPPESLGVDRWLGLVAARIQFRDLIIVSAGTAITIDAVSATGVFLGGVILPGLNAMQRALADSTSLPLAMPVQANWPPMDTISAMTVGAQLAASGAVLTFRRRQLAGAAIIITGGHADTLKPWLPGARIVPHLPIRGMMRLREI
ncbi:type III pantothenate kinase [Candidatus Persebacteraceae bacterium Df01]|jgi:type III pantothenate kinase|uniref:Type III pantothenate kinase n=1 Tax=Candidatus Doriopsillibacter californiensis TaxID=2970740 RepID=A0ABT7QLF0_9GAMM|nr:type III pantothenate kinase [Candidatus Persebacteraceae bacterium Df01]